MFSLPVNPDVSPRLVMGVKIANYQGILSGRDLVEKRAVNMKRGVSIGMTVEINNYDGGI